MQERRDCSQVCGVHTCQQNSKCLTRGYFPQNVSVVVKHHQSELLKNAYSQALPPETMIHWVWEGTPDSAL